MTMLNNKDRKFLNALKKALLSTPSHTRIVNISLGLPPDSLDEDDEIYTIFKILYDRGTTLVVAAGNYGPLIATLNPLALSPWVISVGAASVDGKSLADFSSRGLPIQNIQSPTLVAPGLDVPFPPEDSKKKIIGQVNGTSFACAIVTSICRFISNFFDQVDVEYSPSKLKEVLLRMAIQMPSYAPHEVGAGFVNSDIARNYVYRNAGYIAGKPGIYAFKSNETPEDIDICQIDYKDFYDDGNQS